MPVSKLNILCHSDIEFCDRTVMFQICIVLSYNCDFSRVKPLSKDHIQSSLCFMLNPEDGGILLSRNVDVHNPFGEITSNCLSLMWGR